MRPTVLALVAALAAVGCSSEDDPPSLCAPTDPRCASVERCEPWRPLVCGYGRAEDGGYGCEQDVRRADDCEASFMLCYRDDGPVVCPR